MDIVKIARDRYVKLETQNVRTPSSSISVSTAVRIGCKLLFSNFHVLEADSITTEPLGEKGQTEVTVMGMSTRMDLIAIRSATPAPNLPPIKFAETINVGELVLNYSNADGEDGFLRSYRIAKGEVNGHFLLDQPAIPGESGSGLFNLNGELVGIIDSNAKELTDRLYGTAISASVIKAFHKGVTEGEEDLDTCKK